MPDLALPALPCLVSEAIEIGTAPCHELGRLDSVAQRLTRFGVLLALDSIAWTFFDLD